MSFNKKLALVAAVVVFANAAPAHAATLALTYGGSNYYLSSAATTWAAAQAEAVAMGGHLADINTAAENAALGKVSAFNSRDTFIGLTDAAVEGRFVWTSGAVLTYTNWRIGEPNNSLGSENYVERGSDGLWNDVNGTRLTYGIIEVPIVPVPATPALTFGGSKYYLTSKPMSWAGAEAQAVAMGGHLVDINSAAENAALGTVAAFSSRSVFIGLTDAAFEGRFVWTSGSSASYTNWRIGEPNNSGGAEDYVERDTNGFWNDIDGQTLAYGIIEVRAVPEPGTLALILGGLMAVKSVVRRRSMRVAGAA